MSIEYKYTIISVDPAARCMEVVYSAEGHQTMHISARLPFAGEALENVVELFAPTRLWEELSAVVDIPLVGTTGTVAAPIITIVPTVNSMTATPSSGSIPQEIL